MFSLIRAAISAIPKAAKAVKKAVKKAAKKVKEKVAEVVEDVKETIEELKEEAEEAIGKVFTAARKIANEITSDIVQGLKKKMDSLIASGKKFLNNVKKFGKSVVNGIKYVGKKISGMASAAGGWKQLVSTAIDFVPVLGNVKSAVEAVTGRDPITGRKLEPWERAVSGAAILGGPLVKGVKHGTKAAIGIGEGLSNVGRKFVNKVKENFGKAVEKVSSGLKSLGAKVGDIKVPVKVNVLSMSAGNGINIPVGIRAETKSVKELVQNFKANGTTKGTGKFDNVWDMPRGGGEIGGRRYSEHALERMAPDTIQVRAELEKRALERGLKPGTKEFKDFVDPRGIPPMVVEDTIKNVKPVTGNRPNTQRYDGKDVTVITNTNGDVITVIPK